MRVHFDERYSGSPAFVGQKGFELRECPVVDFGAHRPIQTVPSLSDALQHLDGECLLSVDGHANQGLGDSVVHVTHKTGFFSTALRHPLSSGTRFLRLQLLAQSTVFLAHLFNRFPGVAVAFAVGRNVHDAQVDAYRPVGREGFGLYDGDGAGQVERPVTQE